MFHHGVNIPQEKFPDFCRRNHIRRLSLFGSILTDDFKSGSDVDVLVEFAPGHTPGFLGMASMELELSGLLGHEVDLRTPAELSRYFRQDVLNSCEVQYAEG